MVKVWFGASACDVVLRLRSKPIIWKTNDKQIAAIGDNITYTPERDE